MEKELRELKINTGIPETEFKLPEGIRVKEIEIDASEIQLPEKLSLEEAKEELSFFEILVPEYLPKGYTFNHSIVSKREISKKYILREIESVKLLYINEEGACFSLLESLDKMEIMENILRFLEWNLISCPGILEKLNLGL